jgi:hypothetical protein
MTIKVRRWMWEKATIKHLASQTVSSRMFVCINTRYATPKRQWIKETMRIPHLLCFFVVVFHDCIETLRYLSTAQMRHRGSRIELPCPPVFYDKRFCVGDESVKLWPEQLKRLHYEVESHCNPIFVTRTIRSDMQSSNNRGVRGKGKVMTIVPRVWLRFDVSINSEIIVFAMHTIWRNESFVLCLLLPN